MFTPHDKNGQELKEGDLVIVPCRIVKITGDGYRSKDIQVVTIDMPEGGNPDTFELAGAQVTKAMQIDPIPKKEAKPDEPKPPSPTPSAPTADHTKEQPVPPDHTPHEPPTFTPPGPVNPPVPQAAKEGKGGGQAGTKSK